MGFNSGFKGLNSFVFFFAYTEYFIMSMFLVVQKDIMPKRLGLLFYKIILNINNEGWNM